MAEDWWTGDHLRNSPIPDSLLKSTLSQIIPAVAVAVSVAVVVVVCVSVLFRGVSPLLNPHSDLAILTRRIRRFRAGARDRYSNTFEVIPWATTASPSQNRLIRFSNAAEFSGVRPRPPCPRVRSRALVAAVTAGCIILIIVAFMWIFLASKICSLAFDFYILTFIKFEWKYSALSDSDQMLGEGVFMVHPGGARARSSSLARLHLSLHNQSPSLNVSRGRGGGGRRRDHSWAFYSLCLKSNEV